MLSMILTNNVNNDKLTVYNISLHFKYILK